MSHKQRIQLQPINWVQRIALYVTESRYYLVGSNNTQTAFKILKIDRTENDLILIDDRIEYTYQEIRDILMRIDHGNKTRDNSTGVTKTVSSFGIVGFVRFLHGYYIILIIKRRKVASIGYHTIFKIEDTKLVYIPNKPPTEFVYEESKYLRAFTSINLTSNFYFSYSYDISHSLQYNLAPIRGARFYQESTATRSTVSQSEDDGECHSADSANRPFDLKPKPVKKILVKAKPCDRFLWNAHLIDFEGLHEDWKMNLVHGFVAQASICVYGKPIYVTLIARRSRRYCGTRFLKRGLNLDGDVANEVETEQIVHDSSVSDFTQGYYTSFVQLRGSLPDRWSQDTTKIVAKPQINRDFIDPYHVPTAKHFNDLLQRYGSPIVALNLVKQKEKKPHESILNDMFSKSVGYLNQFLPQQHIIRLIAFDMAHCSKSRTKNVMQRLGKIGFNIVRVTGIFQSWRSVRKSNYDSTYTLHLRQRTFNRKPSSSRIGGYRLRNGQCLQNGLVRVNCVDSLDRTNTAQFVLGKVALAFQLQALGVLIDPSLDFDTDAVRLLEQLYEDHGDTIALQYGGSQLVHRVKTYRKIAPITSHSSEIMQTLSRYYSNTFSDSEKQHVINLFLGIREISLTNAHSILSNPGSDYYLHNRILTQLYDIKNMLPYRQWWNRKLLKSLPRAYNEYEKETYCYALELRDDSFTLRARIDYFSDAYRPFEVTYLDSSFPMQILSTIRDFMPSGALHYSPFCLRLGPGKLKEVYLKLQTKKQLPPNPSVYGLPSTASDTSSELSLMESEQEGENSDLDDISTHPTAVSSFLNTSSTERGGYSLMRYLSEETFSPEIDGQQGHYGEPISTISEADINIYKDYCSIGRSNDRVYSSHKEFQRTICDSVCDLVELRSYQQPNLKSKEFQCVPLTQEDLRCFGNYANFVSA